MILLEFGKRPFNTLFVQSDWDPYLGFESGVCTLVYGAPGSTENTEKKPAEEKKDD